jgi:hypothetical protein
MAIDLNHSVLKLSMGRQLQYRSYEAAVVEHVSNLQAASVV